VFDARLALAEIEMKSGQTTVGREHLTAIEGSRIAEADLPVGRETAAVYGSTYRL